jgi:high-affinity nickel-transport protein
MVHGLAGSAALMLLVLGTIRSPLEGLAYILLFGAGSVLGMAVVSTLIGLPFAVSSRRFVSLNRLVRLAASAASVVLGILIMVQVGFVQGLF